MHRSRFQWMGFGVAVLMLWSLASSTMVAGQNGVSSASASRTRDQSETASVATRGAWVGTPPPAPDKIAVEEIVNLHRHQIPLPGPGQGVRLDVRWGNEVASPGQPSVLQIGLATGEFTGTSDLRPVNLSLVIDASGSMASENKLTVVKAALHTLVSNLRPSDTVSIVSFDDTARVVFPAGPLGNGVSFRRAIEGIQSGGGTNIDAGLMLGYEEALRNFKSNITNRVVLLTDGIANKGERDPRKIADNSSGFNERGIDLSTIGVGHDLDNDLLRTLAKRGRGLYHFVADPTDVAKVFALEAQSLLSAVARYVRVEVTSDSANGLDRVFGYEPRLNGERVSLNLDDLNSGATQVVLLRYRPESVENVAVRLTYLDIARQKQIEETKRISLVRGIRSGNNFLADEEVRKNYTIATIAQALNDMQESWQRRDFVRAENVLHVAVRETRERYPRLDDMDIHAQFEVANRYLATLQRFVGPRFD